VDHRKHWDVYGCVNSSPLCICTNHKTGFTFNTVQCSTYQSSIFQDIHFLSTILLHSNWVSCACDNSTLHTVFQVSQTRSAVRFLATVRAIRTILVRQYCFLLGKWLVQHQKDRYIDVGASWFNFSLGRYSWSFISPEGGISGGLQCFTLLSQGRMTWLSVCYGR
jgi:hypothetical protein